ncbi:hypothetical protein HMPREF0198_1746 [Cardiobacterium hominis ATCC 15826]|uniref:Uncharacterized protein n=1 Tax=Cardiobacterium hominis (strain ATCC 15826 / DSM 8339 / NCTC 10426 / 6573) TaxID=638300 RepID=C8NB68_CARH6|nr:hypothetical protein HMPREF0198_1746 [Cardiobacterium hominis ATCC 15826]
MGGCPWVFLGENRANLIMFAAGGREVWLCFPPFFGKIHFLIFFNERKRMLL